MKNIIKNNKLFITIIMIIIINMIFTINVFAEEEITPNYIINMSQEDLQKLSTETIEEYKSKINDTKFSADARRSAMSRLNKELDRRENAEQVLEESKSSYKDYTPSGVGKVDKITNIAGNVLGLIRNIGVIVSVIALTIIGIKYMVGSVEQKAEYKKNLIPLVIGIAMLAAGTTLIKIIYDIVKDI